MRLCVSLTFNLSYIPRTHTEDQKSKEQKEREAYLIKKLLELIDDKDKLERRKMSTARE